MANEKFDILEFRCVIEPDLTHLYIRVSQAPDSPPMGGWYHTAIPASQPGLPALEQALVTSSYLTQWGRKAP